MNDEDIDLALFCAFRYALGQMSYITGDVSDLLIRYATKLHIATRNKIREEILEAIKNNQAGMPIDVFEWGKVLEKL